MFIYRHFDVPFKHKNVVLVPCTENYLQPSVGTLSCLAAETREPTDKSGTSQEQEAMPTVLVEITTRKCSHESRALLVRHRG